MKILITRPRVQADDFAEKLRSVGFEPIFFPVIEIQPIENNVALEHALEKLNCYAWLVFTSVNAVDVVFSEYSSFFSKENTGVKFAAIGPKTAEALRKYSIEPDFVPEEYVAEAIFPGLGAVKNKKILFPRAEIARKELPEAINRAGGFAHEIVVYRTLPANVDMNGLNALKSGVDVITFTSVSTVENFMALTRQYQLDPLNLPSHPLFVCIGPITEQTARKEGLVKLVVAKEYTTEGLLEAITHLEAS